MLMRIIGEVLGRDMWGERGRIKRKIEKMRKGRRKGNRIEMRISDGDNGVVESRI